MNLSIQCATLTNAPPFPTPGARCSRHSPPIPPHVCPRWGRWGIQLIGALEQTIREAIHKNSTLYTQCWSHLTLHTFVDSFAGCYKDGTEPGTRDCRYFATLFLFMRILIYITYQATLTVYFYGCSGLVFAGITLLLLVAQPYKSMYKQYNTVTAVMFGILTLVVIGILNVNIAFVKVHKAVNFSTITVGLLTVIPQLYATGLVLQWIYKHLIKKLFPRKQIVQRSSESSLLIAPDHRMHTYQ